MEQIHQKTYQANTNTIHSINLTHLEHMFMHH